MASLSVRLAEPGDTAGILELLNASFRTPTDRSTWEWYTGENPFGPTRVYLLCDEADPALAGVFAFTPVPLTLQGKSVMASSGHHLLLKPEYRGGGPFVTLSRGALKGESAAGVHLGLGIPNRNSYHPQKVLMQWADLMALECLYKSRPKSREHTCRISHEFDSRFDAFYARAAAELDFCIHKNAAWMNWRFHQRPGDPYTVYVNENDGELAGYVALKQWREPDGYCKAHIIDFHALDETAAAELISAAETYAAGGDELNLWAAPGYPYRALLEASGFGARESAQQPVIGRMLDGAALIPLSGQCSFSYADGDFVY